MASSSVTLGGFTFQGHEVPEKIPFGGRMRIAKNVFIGGRRVPDAMAWEPVDPRWEGRFRGPNAKSRALALQSIAVRGAQIPLSWGGIYLTVIVEEYEPDYRNFHDIPYRIACYVVDDGTGAGADTGGGDLGTLVGGDLTSVGGLLDAIGAGGLADAVGALSDAVGAIPVLGAATLAQSAGLQSLVSGAVAVADVAVAGLDAALDLANTLDPTLLAGPALADALGNGLDLFQAQDAALQARGLLGRTAINLATLGA